MASSIVSNPVFEWPLRVYMEDTDTGGIVYYVNYLKFIERARTEYLRSLGFGKNVIFNNDLMFVVHSLKADYKKPAHLDDELIATAQVIKVGSAYMAMEQLVYRVGKDLDEPSSRELLYSGEVKIACVDRESMKPQRIPKALLATVAGD